MPAFLNTSFLKWKKSLEQVHNWSLYDSKKIILVFTIILSIFFIYNGNWTGRSAIWAEIICMISKSNEHAVGVQFEITSMISYQNCTTQGSITTLLHPFWNHPNTGLGQFKYFIDAVLNWFEITFIHFWGEKNWSFGNKSCKICHMILFVFHFPAIWLVTLNKPQNLMGCFVFNVACSLAWKRRRFKAKNGAIHEWIAPSRANQITGTTSDFKMDVVKT